MRTEPSCKVQHVYQQLEGIDMKAQVLEAKLLNIICRKESNSSVKLVKKQN